MSNPHPDEPVTTVNLLRYIHQAWQQLQTYLEVLSLEQFTRPTDAQGWTVKDHLIHLAIWEHGIDALLNRRSRSAAMGIDEALWDESIDVINETIRQQNADRNLEDVRETMEQYHQALIDTIESLKDEDLLRPYSLYAPESTQDKPVVAFIAGNTFEHYAEHLPWIKAIVEK